MGLNIPVYALASALVTSSLTAACGGEVSHRAGDGGSNDGGAQPAGGAAGVGGGAGLGGAAGMPDDCSVLAHPASGMAEPADFGELEYVAQAVRFAGDAPDSSVGFDLDCSAEERCRGGVGLGPRGIDNQFHVAVLSSVGQSPEAIRQYVEEGTWSILVRLRSRSDGRVEAWVMSGERAEGGSQGAEAPAWQPWPELQGRLNAPPVLGTMQGGHVVTEPSGALAIPLDITVLAGRPRVDALFADIAPPDDRGARRVVLAGRVARAEIERAVGELLSCCSSFSCPGAPLGDLRHANEPWELCEDLSFGIELELAPASIGGPTADRTGTSACAD